MYKITTLAIVLVSFVSCTGENKLEHFDSDSWIIDSGGCNYSRAELVQPLLDNKVSLEGLGQEGIRKILGNPDRHELYSRNKKAFVYYISPGPDCPSPNTKKQRLVIRFDGIGRAKEIVYYN